MTKVNESLYMNGDFDYVQDSNITAEIGARMQVPQRIKVNETDIDYENEADFTAPQFYNKVDMYVPERILVVGQDQHIGTQAPPLELEIENTIMPRTIPPRDYPSPVTIKDYEEHYKKSKYDGNVYTDNDVNPRIVPQANIMESSIDNSRTDAVVEEVVHLRKQLVKLNRRIMNLERDMDSYQQRDKVLLSVVSVYFVIKILMWMNRSS